MSIRPNHQTQKMDYITREGDKHKDVANILIPIKIIDRFDTVEGGLMELETVIAGQSKRFKVPITCLSSQEETNQELLKHHYLISFNYINALRAYLIEQMRLLQDQGMIEWQYSGLGYTNLDGQRVFLLGDTQLPNGGVARYHDASFHFSRGSEADYRSFLDQHIINGVPTQLALTIGLAAPLATRLRELADVQTIILNITGPSSTGKTTIAQFIASLWGEARLASRGIIRTFNSTVNALTAGNEGINGVPIVLDDLSGSTIQDKTQFVYTLSQGEPKARATTSGKLQSPGNPWSGVILITSETPILNDTEIKQGLLVRVIDSQGLVWTKSAEHAEAIKRFIATCYGHTGRQFVLGLEAFSDYELMERFESARAEVLTAMSIKDNLTQRIVNKLAVLHLASEMVSTILGIPLDRPAILAQLVSFDQATATDRSVGVRAYEAIKNHIINHFNAYEAYHENGTPSHYHQRRGFQARIEFKEGVVSATYPFENFKKVLEEAGIFEFKYVLDFLAANNLCAIREGNRRVIKDAKFKTRVVRIYIKQELFSGMLPWLGHPITDQVGDDAEPFVEEDEDEKD